MEENLKNALLKHFNKDELVNMVGDNEEFIDLLINTYFDGYYKYMKNIYKAIEERNQEALKLNVHSLTGSSKSVCFEIMASICNELENMEFDDIDRINSLYEDIENEIQIIKDLLNRD